MKKNICDVCGVGSVVMRDLHNYATKIRGRQITVPVAHVKQCNSCGEVYIPAKELKKWETLAQSREGLIPLRPSDICDLRNRLGMSVNDFALFTGSTRQSIYSWENAENVIAPIRPIMVLLSLIQKGLSEGEIDIIAELRSLSGLQTDATRWPTCRSRPSSRSRALTHSLADYGRTLALPSDATPRNLPGLR
jgi:YgiT-type zinc finger domain-containing protein